MLDLYDDWVHLSGVEESGCVLVRPDAHVAWRRQAVADDCVTELERVMNQILGFGRPADVKSDQVEEAVEA